MGVPAISENIRPLNRHESKQITSTYTASKAQLNAGIINSAVDLSIKSGDDSMALLLKTAIEGVNEALHEANGVGTIQQAYDAGVDVTPEATADRIVSISTGFFSLYQNQHPELNQQEAVEAFSEIILGGIKQGFAEAREILDGLSVLNGDIATNIEKTYDLVLEGLTAFSESY